MFKVRTLQCAQISGGTCWWEHLETDGLTPHIPFALDPGSVFLSRLVLNECPLLHDQLSQLVKACHRLECFHLSTGTVRRGINRLWPSAVIELLEHHKDSLKALYLDFDRWSFAIYSPADLGDHGIRSLTQF
jgi:hypothetical protein